MAPFCIVRVLFLMASYSKGLQVCLIADFVVIYCAQCVSVDLVLG